jgi:hypothetical protein
MAVFAKWLKAPTDIFIFLLQIAMDAALRPLMMIVSSA